METRKRNRRLKLPCPQCPYTLGQVHTVVNPCPQCKEENYQMFEWFSRRLPESCFISEGEGQDVLRILPVG